MRLQGNFTEPVKASGRKGLDNGGTRLYQNVDESHYARAGMWHGPVHVSTLHLGVRMTPEQQLNEPLREAVSEEEVCCYKECACAGMQPRWL